jgi:hypothetical protein
MSDALGLVGAISESLWLRLLRSFTVIGHPITIRITMTLLPPYYLRTLSMNCIDGAVVRVSGS